MASLVHAGTSDVETRQLSTQAAGHYRIRRVGVLGAGTMGARIAAHIANARIPVLLLDLASEGPKRSLIPAAALDALMKSKPPAFAGSSAASLIKVGNFEEDIPKLNTCDWVIEAVAEDLQIKQSLLARVSAHLASNAILTTNTSGLPVSKVGEGLPEPIRRRWFGTHFFNPPRYMRLLEVITTPETDADAVEAIETFAELRLGKTIVRAKDSPNFIANRIGVFAMLNTIRVMQAQGLTIEEVDLLTGPVIGWPKTGTFRLADMVGIDVIRNVARNFAAAGSDERSDVALPAAIEKMVESRWLGDKTKQGFYKKSVKQDGAEQRLVFDLTAQEYRPSVRANIPSLELAKSNEDLGKRIRQLMGGDPRDKASAFYRTMLPELFLYCANRLGEVCDNLIELDQAMKSGFNWELGPFQMWDAAGVQECAHLMTAASFQLPPAVQELFASGEVSWYRSDGAEYFDPSSRSYKRIERNPELLTVAHFRKVNARHSGNPGVSLIDVGEGIGCFEFHSKMNTIGRDIVTFLSRELRDGSDAMKHFDGFVITGDSVNFSAGANLMQLLLAIQDEEWDEIDRMVRDFQQMTRSIKFCSSPVVVAPFGMCLGGGVEISLHAARRQAHLELYTGLVEAGVGLVPAGGGCKEMLLRALAAASKVRPDPRGDSVEVIDSVKSSFEVVAMAKVSSSATEAQFMRLLSEEDGLTMNRDRLLFDAKQQVLAMLRQGYVAPQPRTDIPAPGASIVSTLRLGVYLMREGEYISDHDAKIADHLARIFAGGELSPGTQISEDYLLDLERESFLSLCGEPKTKERVSYMLKNGKPLRN